MGGDFDERLKDRWSDPVIAALHRNLGAVERETQGRIPGRPITQGNTDAATGGDLAAKILSV